MKYHHAAIAELTHQLKLSPVRLRFRQLDAAEYLVDLLEADKHYPYDFVCHHLTGFRPKGAGQSKPMSGESLIEDVVLLVEELSGTTVLPVGALGETCWTTEELAQRLSVSTKTICRWRRRGLPGRKLRYPDGTVRMAFLERAVRRFVTRHCDLVQRGAAFKQLTPAEKKRIVALAGEAMAERRMRLHELSQHVAAQVGRAVETVRYTLRRHDRAHPEEALFSGSDEPVIDTELQAIYDAVQAGGKPPAVARQFERSVASIHAVVREVRARLLKAREIQYIANPEFEAPSADETILNPRTDDDDVRPKRIRPPKDLPPYLQDLYRQPLFTPRQERDMFRRYNYLKYKADRLRSELDVLSATEAQLDDIEELLDHSDMVKNEILKANLRLVVSIARRHVGRSPQFFEIVSDGNLSLMRAVEKFDYARGFKFSTYASWAIMRNYARSIPEEMYHSARLVTGSDELLATASVEDDTARDSMLETARYLVRKGLSLLSTRERDVLSWHYGLEKGRSPMTLDQIGRVIGVTKERVRQIERKAMNKLRKELGEQEREVLEDFASA